MKKIILSFAALGALFASAATFKENLAAKDYAAAAAQLNWNMCWDKTATKLITTVELANTLYEATGTNRDGANLAAHIALSLGDKSVMQKYLDSYDGEGVDTSNINHVGIVVCGQAWLDYLKTGTGWFKYTDSEGKEAFQVKSLNDVQPEMMLKFYKRMAAAGKYDIASLAFFNVCGSQANGNSRNLAPFVGADWQKFITDTFTIEVVENLTDNVAMHLAINYFARLDVMNSDASFTISSKYCTPTVLKKIAEGNTSFQMISCSVKQEEFQKLNVAGSKSPNVRVYAAKWLDKKAGNKEASRNLFSWIVQNGTWNDVADFALYIGDKDKIINTFKNIGLTATPAQLNGFIESANALDVGYRTDEVKSILATINKKYTLKLYDDRDTWEPILSKVRALMEIL